MQLVVDTNILLSGLLKPAATQKLLLSPNNILFLPEYSLREVEKHAEELTKRMEITRKDFEILLFSLLRNVKLVPEEEYNSFKTQAISLCPEGHEDDWPFLALALKLGIPLWSQDSALKKQSKVTVYTTTELMQSK